MVYAVAQRAIAEGDFLGGEGGPGGATVRASQQFESILLRQFLSESMKSLLEGGEAGQFYGYLLTDAAREDDRGHPGAL